MIVNNIYILILRYMKICWRFYLDYMERRNRKQKKKHSHEGKKSTINSYVASIVATFAS
jgi:hypothetical protein